MLRRVVPATRKLFAALVGAIAFLVSPAPAVAIIDGKEDTAHRYVGVLVADVPGFGLVAFCSGTLISPTAFVTAGHCVSGDLGGAELLGISFALDPFSDPDLRSHVVPIGSMAVYPGFALPDAFKDVAVITLARPVRLGSYAALPALGSLEPLKEAKPGTVSVTVVGYGWQQWVPHSAGLGVRRFTTGRLLSFLYPVSPPGKGDESTSSLLTVAKSQGSKGSVCYSDSGGPVFNGATNVISAITVAGSKNCTGSWYGLRLDTVPVLSFLPAVRLEG